MDQLRRGSFDNLVTGFVLLTTDDNGKQNEIQIKCAYVIVDNGYLAWSTTVLLLKDSVNRSEIRFLQWLAWGITKRCWVHIRDTEE